MDGEMVRNSGGGYADVKLFSAMVHGQAVVITQARVPDGTNEITVCDHLCGAVVTADAAHCQDATAGYLTGRDADYVLTVKGNRKTLLKQVKASLGQVGLDHLDGCDGEDRIRREVRDTCGRLISKEVVHRITSLSTEQGTAEAVARWVRTHWGIENEIHRVRDVVLGEDAQHAYLGAAAQVMALFRNLAIALLRLAGITKVTQTLERIAADRSRILPILAASRP